MRDIQRPMNSAGTATTNPAIGPATPMSNSAILSGKRDLIRMNAPSVPVSVKSSGAAAGSTAASR